MQKQKEEIQEESDPTTSPIFNVRTYLKKRNVSFRDLIKYRNMLMKTVTSLTTYLPQLPYAVSMEEEKKEDILITPTIPEPLQEPLVRKQAIRAALQEYLRTKK